MRVLMVHNYYRQAGGEKASFHADRDVLCSHGHEVIEFTLHNETATAIPRHELAIKTVWNREVASEVTKLAREIKPDVVHFQNTFPIISPATYRAVHRAGIPVVNTVRNYRLLCVNAMFFRDGKVCTDCVGSRLQWRGVQHACYRADRAASAVAAVATATHRALGTWSKTVDQHIVLSEFAKTQLADVLPVEKMVVEPNCVHPDPLPGAGGGGYALYLGRLTAEKGVRTLLAAWTRHDPGIPLMIAGTGPLSGEVERVAQESHAVTVVGEVPSGRASELLADAAVLVFPSLWFETFGRSVIEAFAHATPVVATNLGAHRELLLDGVNGCLVEPDSPAALAAAVGHITSGDTRRWRAAARRTYEARYTGAQHARNLVDIYVQAGAPAERPVIDLTDDPAAANRTITLPGIAATQPDNS